MRLEQTGTWLLIAACCAVCVPLALRAELRTGFYRRHAAWREAPGAFAGACAGALLTGVALGMCVAFAAVTLAAIAEHVRS